MNLPTLINYIMSYKWQNYDAILIDKKPEVTITFRKICRVRGTLFSVKVKAEDLYSNLIDNTLVQVTFPNLTIEEREFLITGITPAEWEELFRKEEEEEMKCQEEDNCEMY